MSLCSVPTCDLFIERGENKGRDFLHHTPHALLLSLQGKWSFLSLVVAVAVAAAAVVVVPPPSVIVSIIPGLCLTQAIPPLLHQSPASLQLRFFLTTTMMKTLALRNNNQLKMAT